MFAGKWYRHRKQLLVGNPDDAMKVVDANRDTIFALLDENEFAWKGMRRQFQPGPKVHHWACAASGLSDTEQPACRLGQPCRGGFGFEPLNELNLNAI